MSSINLKTFDRSGDGFNLSESREEILHSGYKWADLKLDLTLGDIITNFPVDQASVNIDAQNLVDTEAVKQAVKNIFNTIPGQKLLNPYLGLDLKRFLFSPITEETGREIAHTIVKGLVEQEPRISVKNIKVEGIISEETYYVSFVIIFPDIKNKEVIVDGRLSSAGFALTSENKQWESKQRQVRDRYWNFN